jgi:NAD(P)-dependent dehydrogenase (short-subunit alcohol dehydrogenase family)
MPPGAKGLVPEAELLEIGKVIRGLRILPAIANPRLRLFPDHEVLAVGLEKQFLVENPVVDQSGDHVPVARHHPNEPVLFGSRSPARLQARPWTRRELPHEPGAGSAHLRLPSNLIEPQQEICVLLRRFPHRCHLQASIVNGRRLTPERIEGCPVGYDLAMKLPNDPVVFITGASSGIGAALAREFALRGARLVLAARRFDRLESLAAEIARGGRKALPVACDVRRDGDLDAAAARAKDEFGRIDIVIANAGFGVVGEFETLTLEDYRRQFETNVFGVLRTVFATLEDLKRSRGRLALIGSVAGYVGLPASTPYGMSKFAVRALAAGLGPELQRHGVSVTHIAPGFVESEINQVDNLGRLHPDKSPAHGTWRRAPVAPAARQIARGILLRRREVVITRHGKIAVFFERHASGLVDRLIMFGYLHPIGGRRSAS